MGAAHMSRRPRLPAPASPPSPAARQPGPARGAAESGAGRAGPAQRRSCRHLRSPASRPPPQPGNRRDVRRLGRACRRRFISGSPGRFLALTAEGKDREAGWSLGGKPGL